MIVRKFLQWSETAGARDRARAANALARAFIISDLSRDDAKAAEAAMTILLDDPSPLVRLAMAEALATSAMAPRSVIHGLARDQLDVAGLVVCCSPVLNVQDLVDLAADGRAGVQRAIAMRRDLNPAVCAALAEVGGQMAVGEMLDNETARVARITLRRITERFGDDAGLRSRLLERSDLPCDVRHALIMKVGEALAGSSFVAGIVGHSRIKTVTKDACQHATLQLAGNIAGDDIPALVEHLRLAGKLTPAFLMHTLCVGNIDFFASAIASISGVSGSRVRGLLVDGRRNAIHSLYQSGGIDSIVCEVFVSATLLWRRATQVEGGADAMKITQQLMEQYAQAQTQGHDQNLVADLLMLVERMNLDFRRQAAKNFAASMTFEAA